MDNTSAEDQETIREFLVESHENLTRLDQDLVELEKHPDDRDLLGSIFRTIHTIKGACGFLAFSVLEAITHQAETLLSQLRDGQRELTPALVSLILETVDATRKVLAAIETSGKEGSEHFEDLTERLRLAAQLTTAEPPPSVVEPKGVSAPPVPVMKSVVEKGPSTLREEGPPDRKDDRGKKKEGGKEEDATRSSAAVDSNIRVGVGLLDKLMDLVGELVLTRNQILQFNIEREDPALNATSQRLNLITTELQEGVMKTRMQPIGVVWNKLPRVVRDMATTLGKQIRLQMDGADTELDRTIIEAIKDPLMHLVRNSCDHGIEVPEVRVRAGKSPQGTLTLRAYHEGGQVNIEIGDDGAGIDVARVKQKALENGLLRPEQAEKLSDREALGLIFQPGFSTAQVVTNFSGRGVGMDVVKSHIEKIGGVVDISSRLGEGATVKIRIPLTLAIIPGLVITSGGERFVIPQVSLLELLRLESDASGKHIEYVHGTPVYRRRGSLLPIAYLNQVLGLKSVGTRRGRQHGGTAGGRPAVRTGGRWYQRHPGDRGETVGQAVEGAHAVCRRHHHGRWASSSDPGRAGHWPTIRCVSRVHRAGAHFRTAEGAGGSYATASLTFPGRFFCSLGGAALSRRPAGRVSAVVDRTCQWRAGGAISRPDSSPGGFANSA